MPLDDGEKSKKPPVDTSLFASILAGVQQMRDSFEPVVAKETGQSAHSERLLGIDINNRPPERAQNPSEPPIRSENSETRANTGNARPITDNRRVLTTHTGNVSTTPRVQTSTARRPRQGVQTYTSVQVANSQKGNPLLESPLMKVTPWAYSGQILSDYYINATLQVLFLSLKYHKLRPEYVWRRIEKLKGGTSSGAETHISDQALRVLLVVVDIDSPQEAIRHLLGICIKQDLSMIVAWSFEEAGNYIAYFKQNELANSKVDSSIQGLKKSDFNLNIVETLTTVRAVNKTDVANLLANYKSFKNVVLLASLDQGVGDIQGLGDRKLKNLRGAFTEPFVFNKNYDE